MWVHLFYAFIFLCNLLVLCYNFRIQYWRLIFYLILEKYRIVRINRCVCKLLFLFNVLLSCFFDPFRGLNGLFLFVILLFLPILGFKLFSLFVLFKNFVYLLQFGQLLFYLLLLLLHFLDLLVLLLSIIGLLKEKIWYFLVD